MPPSSRRGCASRSQKNLHRDTGVCEKKAPPDKKTPGIVPSKIAKSGAE